jgi:hypothetical protein
MMDLLLHKALAAGIILSITIVILALIAETAMTPLLMVRLSL